ncbi:MerR family transcriptional regulator [Paraburkholderia megapolitana]|uniref:Transcriptional regulator, MerR family n=1 Tax=Paraburkholderia megapolitana TaxID=420953 RepID=A0A1I3RJW4_9BURK|nr:MerR family transcriptional regulator [Paraburkholderia megapolitana]QDQ83865.1 MerR family transcriptional regulator [Paraburkholderia megapolitana]SFJ45456.1 transcriptional regulator, MerR family [Paraburkholderia megapolitana]
MPTDPASPLLTVQDAAKQLQVTPRTLKYYEERGLVTPTRSEGRYRLYDDADLERFARILRLRSLGFSLQGITEMLKRPFERHENGRSRLSDESLREVRDALTQQIDALNTRIDAVRRELKEAQALKTELSRDLEYVERRVAGESVDVLLEQRRNALARKRTTAAKQTDQTQPAKAAKQTTARNRSA